MKRLRIGILYGGRSGEHEVSLASAAAVFANVDRRRYEPVAIRIEKDGRWLLADRPPSAASAADVLDQMRSEASRPRTGRDVVLPPRPGDDTLILVNRRSGRTDDAEAAARADAADGLTAKAPSTLRRRAAPVLPPWLPVSRRRRSASGR